MDLEERRICIRAHSFMGAVTNTRLEQKKRNECIKSHNSMVNTQDMQTL
jgi:hypothetical protein